MKVEIRGEDAIRGPSRISEDSRSILPKPKKGRATRRRLWGAKGHPPARYQQVPGRLASVQNGTALRPVLSYCVKMRKRDLTAKECFSVPCPTCGVAPGEPCLLHSGALRTEPHVDRKFSAAEAIEANRIPRSPGQP